MPNPNLFYSSKIAAEFTFFPVWNLFLRFKRSFKPRKMEKNMQRLSFRLTKQILDTYAQGLQCFIWMYLRYIWIICFGLLGREKCLDIPINIALYLINYAINNYSKVSAFFWALLLNSGQIKLLLSFKLQKFRIYSLVISRFNSVGFLKSNKVSTFNLLEVI
jgi:hypothetical protein